MNSNAAAKWTTPEDIRTRVGRRWRSGQLLRLWAANEPFCEIDLPLRGPTARDLADHLEDARAWDNAIRRASAGGRAFDVVDAHVGGRHLGRSTIPRRARLTSFDQVWQLLGVHDQVERYREILHRAAEFDAAGGPSSATSRPREWALEKPLIALQLAPVWPQVLSAFKWLTLNRGSGKYLRQVSVPGVHTKFIASHRQVLADMLEVRRGAGDFLTDLGLSATPTFLRMRFHPGAFGMPESITEVQLQAPEFHTLATAAGGGVEHVLVIENEITYLSVPVPAGGVVMWGRGYAVHNPAAVEWLRQRRVTYWGDLDTHGFAILNRLRRHLPNVRSVMMDERTLLAHQDHWVSEPQPTNADLTHLTPQELRTYRDLVTDRFGDRVRLEQEYISWPWALEHLAAVGD